MMQISRGTFLTLVFSLLLSMAADVSGAILSMDLKQLAERSRHVLCGKVTELKSYWTDMPNMGRVIVTEARIQVRETWKGKPGKTITINYFGGKVGDESMLCAESPTYEVGEEVLVFTREWKGALWTCGWFQGKYKMTRTAEGTFEVHGKKHLPLAARETGASVRERVLKWVRVQATTPEESGARLEEGANSPRGSK